ncbi:MAG: ATP-binding protein [Pyrobaculum sp.]
MLKELPKPVDMAAELVDLAIGLLYSSIKRRIRRKIALLADDVFQATGLDKAEAMVKRLLNMIEHPSISYEKIVVLVVTSEGASRERIGRHRWADLLTMWNMPREGFRRLYDLLPGEKPPFEEVWRWTGGNPKALERLYLARWDVGKIVTNIKMRGLSELVSQLSEYERDVLKEAIEDPDVILRSLREAKRLRDLLIEKNLIIRVADDREQNFWIDAPPPERDPELGIGKYYAWQTPLHREAVRRALAG